MNVELIFKLTSSTWVSVGEMTLMTSIVRGDSFLFSLSLLTDEQ